MQPVGKGTTTNYFNSFEEENINWQRLEDEISMSNQHRSNASAIISASDDNYDDDQMDIDSMVSRSK